MLLSLKVARCYMLARKVLLLCVLVLGVAEAAPQPMFRLLDYTSEWKFDESGTDRGTTWREFSYDDGLWQSGPGLFGLELNFPYPYPFAIATGLVVTNTIITYYFRTHFQLAASDLSPALGLLAQLYADDGCVLYINGAEAGHVRMQANQNYQTPTGFPALGSELLAEGLSDAVWLRTDSLVPGDNVLAVEVHQQIATSSRRICSNQMPRGASWSHH